MSRFPIHPILVATCVALLRLDAVAADANGDGMDDTWQQVYGAGSVTAGADADGDGATNQAESLMGTNPFDGRDCLRLHAPVQRPRAVLLQWLSVPRKRYVVEWMVGNSWVVCDDGLAGTGMMLMSALPRHAIGSRLVRIRCLADTTAATASLAANDPSDSDGDGQGDYFEFLAGTDHLDEDSVFEISSMTYGNAVSLRWQSTAGKTYQLETSDRLDAGGWTRFADPVDGTGGPIEVDAYLPVGSGRFFRLRVGDTDSDGDGMADWGATVASDAPMALATGVPSGTSDVPVVRVELAAATALVNRKESAAFRLVRDGLLGPLRINLQAGGSALPGREYFQLPNHVDMAAGQRVVEVPVKPKVLSMPLQGKSVSLKVLPGAGYAVGPDCPWDVKLVSEHRLSVKDFGATGDGVTDDTAAIQAALGALEQSSQFNTLWFPSGKYRLATISPQGWTSGSYHCSLQLGGGAPDGRDLIFSGQHGATLYAEPGDVRSQMLVVPANCRSYSFRGLTWEKDPTPRRMPSAGVEPNWSDGVSLVNGIGAMVAEASFVDCTFINCHCAVRTYSSGTDHWGKLGVFRMQGCRVLNPYGSNVHVSPQPYGGGQQVNLNPWVRYAAYEGNEFNGSSDGPIDEALNPGREPKDGCHFGSPQELRFVNNLVRNMGVEAVFQTQDSAFSSTASAFVVPSPGADPTEVVLQPWWESTPVPGHHYNFRTYPPGGGQVLNVLLTAQAYLPETRTLYVRNDGLSDPGVTGMIVPAGTTLNWQEAPAGRSVIHGNVVTGGRASAIGIITNSRSDVSANHVTGYGIGLSIVPSPAMPLVHTGKGSRFTGNFIMIAADEVAWARNGLFLQGPGMRASDNLVVMPRPSQACALFLDGPGIHASANRLLAIDTVPRPYHDAQRSVGIGISGSAVQARLWANRTKGFDLGVGQARPGQATVPFTVEWHTSEGDTIPIDPLGAMP